jgi:hypothetical protein
MSVSGVIGSEVCEQFALDRFTPACAAGSTKSAAKAITKLRVTECSVAEGFE